MGNSFIIYGVYIPLMIWFIVMLIFLAILIKKFPLRKWEKGEDNPYKTETMGIPRGTIRGIISITLLIGAVLLQIYALMYLENDEKISGFMNAFEIMLAFYFGSKVLHHVASVDKNKTKAIADAAKENKDNFDDVEAKG
jgi:H+/gluconate symporter-like permease